MSCLSEMYPKGIVTDDILQEKYVCGTIGTGGIVPARCGCIFDNMARRRKRGQLVRDRRRIADLYLQGWAQTDIADELALHQTTVSRDIKTLHKDWLESSLLDFSDAKSQELAKVDRLEREYWKAYHRSLMDAEQITKEGTSFNEDTQDIAIINKIAKITKKQAGDPRFLQGIQWCIDKRCSILGLDAPEKQSGEVLIKIVRGDGTNSLPARTPS